MAVDEYERSVAGQGADGEEEEGADGEEVDLVKDMLVKDQDREDNMSLFDEVAFWWSDNVDPINNDIRINRTEGLYAQWCGSYQKDVGKGNQEWYLAYTSQNQRGGFREHNSEGIGAILFCQEGCGQDPLLYQSKKIN